MGIPDQLVPADIKNQRLQPYYDSQLEEEPIEAHLEVPIKNF